MNTVTVCLNSGTKGGFPALEYNENRVANREGECIMMANCGELGKYNIHDAALLNDYFTKICDRNNLVNLKQMHYSFSLPGKVSREAILNFAQDCKKALDNVGFAGQPMVIWWHWNTDHDHIHVVAPRVSVADGHNINLWWEAARVRRELDLVRGRTFEKTNEEIMKYDFRSKNEFLSLLRAQGYRSYYDGEKSDIIHIRRGGMESATVSVANLDGIIADRKAKLTKEGEDERKARAKQLQAIILKYRTKSLADAGDKDKSAKNSWKNKPDALNKTLHTNHTPIAKEIPLSPEESADLKDLDRKNFKKFLDDLKAKTGIDIAMTTNKKGEVTGYTVIDNAQQRVFKGSDVLHLRRLLNPSAKVADKVDQDIAQAARRAVEEKQGEKEQSVIEKERQSSPMPEQTEQPNKLSLEWFKNYMRQAGVIVIFDKKNRPFAVEYNDQNGERQRLIFSPEYLEFINKRFAISKDEGLFAARASAVFLLRDSVFNDPDLMYFLDYYAQAGDIPFNSQRSEIQPRQPETQQPKPKQETTKIVPFLYFVDVQPTVFVDENNQTCVKVKIDGLEYDPVQVSEDLARWYNEEENKDMAGFQLALHYFRDEIQARQIQNYHRRFFSAGTLPYGINIDSTYANSDGSGKCWVKGWFTHSEQQFNMTVNIPNEEYRKYYTAPEKDQAGIRRRLVSRFIGPKILENVQVPSISDLINDRFESPAPADTVDALNQSVETFKDFTQDLCTSFADSCGDIATAYFNAVMSSHGITPSGGGGGHDTGGWGRKKDDDDWFRRKPGLMDRPKGRKR